MRSFGIVFNEFGHDYIYSRIILNKDAEEREILIKEREKQIIFKFDLNIRIFSLAVFFLVNQNFKNSELKDNNNIYPI